MQSFHYVLQYLHLHLDTTISVTRFGDFLDFGQLLKPLATINLPKSPTVLGNFCVVAKIYHFSSEIIFGQLLWTFGNFSLVTLKTIYLDDDVNASTGRLTLTILIS